MSTMPTMPTNHRIAVVGMPGTGKSKFLNALINHFKCKDVEQFKARDEVGQRILQIPAYNEQGQVVPNSFLQLTLVDTVGWPCTDPMKSVRMYDETVRALNHANGLTAVIWVVDSKRDDWEALAKYKAFMTEISRVTCEIILLVNGRENYSDQLASIMDADNPREKEKLQKELDVLKEKDRGAMHRIADRAVEQVNLEKPRRFVKVISTDVTELNKKVPVEIHKLISGFKPSSGNAVRTFEEMALTMANSEEVLKQDTQDIQATIDRLEAEKAEAEWYNNVGLYGGGSAAGAVALGVLYVTSGLLTSGVTWVAGAALAGAAVSGAAYTFVYDGHADEKGKKLEEQRAKLEEQRAKLQEQRAKIGNKADMLQAAKEENFKALCRCCQVDHVEFVREVNQRKLNQRQLRHGA